MVYTPLSKGIVVLCGGLFLSPDEAGIVLFHPLNYPIQDGPVIAGIPLSLGAFVIVQNLDALVGTVFSKLLNKLFILLWQEMDELGELLLIGLFGFLLLT